MRPRARAIVSVGFAACLLFCGGQIVVDQPLGHATDDGGYVLPDGAPAFVAGHGCMDDQASQLPPCDDEGVGCWYGVRCDGAASQCAEEIQKLLPPGYPLFAGCRSGPADGVSQCVFNQQIPYLACYAPGQSLVAMDPLLACHTGADGDAFCSAYLTQYVLGGGVASAKCVPACQPTDNFDGNCATTTGAGYFGSASVGQPCGPSSDCEGLLMCVTRNGQSRCEPPCMPPP